MSDAHVFADMRDAAERYLLGQMSESDRDAYERHFFECVDCAEDVKATARVIDGCKTVLAGRMTAGGFESRIGARFPGWAVAVMAGALAATLAVVAYQNVVTIPALTHATAPQALTSVSLVTSNARGAAVPIAVSSRQPFLIYVDIPPDPHDRYDTYDFAFVSKDGRSVTIPPVSAQMTRESVPVLIGAGLLAPGEYTLRVSGRARVAGDPSVEVAHFTFTLRFVD